MGKRKKETIDEDEPIEVEDTIVESVEEDAVAAEVITDEEGDNALKSEKLGKDETDIEVILGFLNSEETKLRGNSLLRLEALGPELDIDDIDFVIEILNKFRKEEKGGKLARKMDKILNDFWNYKKDIEFENPVEFIELDFEEKLVPKKVVNKKRMSKKRFIYQEKKDLKKHSFFSMHSSERLHYHTWYVSIIRTLALLYFTIMMFFAVWGLWDELNGNYGLNEFFIYLFLGFVGTFSILLSAEVIQFYLDFHDANYTNTKVRIETLKVLKEISENLKK